MLLVDGEVFASGTYTCNGSGCTFTGVQLLGASKSFTFTFAGLSAAANGSLHALFATHGAWVSAVAKWAQANLTTMRVGQIVRAAASIQGQSQKASQGSSTATATARGAEGKGRNK